MAAVVLTLILAFVIAGAVWLIVGSRLRLSTDAEQNDRLNFALYYVGTVPVSFVLVFFGLGG